MDGFFSDRIGHHEKTVCLFDVLGSISSHLLKEAPPPIVRMDHQVERKGPQNQIPINRKFPWNIREVADDSSSLFDNINEGFSIRPFHKFPFPEFGIEFVLFHLPKNDFSER